MLTCVILNITYSEFSSFIETNSVVTTFNLLLTPFIYNGLKFCVVIKAKYCQPSLQWLSLAARTRLNGGGQKPPIQCNRGKKTLRSNSIRKSVCNWLQEPPSKVKGLLKFLNDSAEHSG